ncbi:ferredoxin Fer [Halobacterium yunchengense]|uniref:ferredoxin Fer n=1 Tax=Halobacterium yunchengense TaxID=3108497 RepID=UPI0030083316
MESPYDVLGVDEDADDGEIRRAYRRRVKDAHPDQGGSAAEFQLVRAAYEAVLSGEADVEADEDGSSDAAPDVAQPAYDVEPDEDFEPWSESRVEYLNYAVLDDYGWGLDDDDLFEKAGAADLDSVNHGEFVVDPGESLLEAAEDRGYAWPYACRGGACANCAVLVVDGNLSQPTDHILSAELLDRDIRLSCNGIPTTSTMRVVYNVKHLPGLEELRLPPYPFELAHADD